MIMRISTISRFNETLATLALAFSVASCHRSAPQGQVLVTVDGHEITAQDLSAEARAGGGTQAPGQVLLQRVIARQLLADDGHAQRLDSYSGFPADIARLRAEFLAQRDVRSQVKRPVAPSDSAIAQFINSHPYAFADRMRLMVDLVRFQSADDLRSIKGLDTLDQVVTRLKQLNVQLDRQKQQLDTATLPPDLAAKLLGSPEDALVILKSADGDVALQILARQSIGASAEQQKAEARQLMIQSAAQKEIDTVVNRLRSAAHIVYQPGYEPKTLEKASPHPAV